MAQLIYGPLTGRKGHLNGSLKGPNSSPTTIGPIDLWTVNRLKVTPGQKLAQHLNGPLKGRNAGPTTKWPIRFMGHQQAKRHTGPEISPTFKWVAKRPKDVHPKNWHIH